MKTGPVILSAILLLIPVFASAVDAKARDIYLWPLLIVDQDASGSDIRVLTPLGEFSRKDSKTVRAVRPVFIFRKENGNWRSIDLAWPLINLTRGIREDLAWRAFPMFWNSEDGDRRFALFPFLWTWWDREHSPEKEWGVVVPPAWICRDYGHAPAWSSGTAPLWWAWRGEDSRGFWATPYYRRRSLSNPEDRAVGILPLFWDWREREKRGTMATPVYWQRQDGELTHFVLFPVYWYSQDDHIVFPFYWSLGRSRLRAIFPFYGRVSGEDKQWLLAMWPCYMRTRDGKHLTHDVLWPVFTWGGDGEGNAEFSVWPLSGWERESHTTEKRSEEGRSFWALAKLIGRGASEETTRPGDDNEEGKVKEPRRRQSRYFYVFPLYWTGRTETRKVLENGDSGEVVEGHHYNWLLPLYTYNVTEEKKVFTMVWPLWRSTCREEQDQYSILWRLMDARFYPNGDKRITVLWQGYRNVKQGDAHKIDMFPFVTYRREGSEWKRFQFLGGLLQFGADSGKRHMRLMYSPRIPLGRR